MKTKLDISCNLCYWHLKSGVRRFKKNCPKCGVHLMGKKQSLKSMRDQHAGQPIAVLGAGPSLLIDFSKLPKDTVLVAVNHHATLHVDCDYLVFCDLPTRAPDSETAHLDYIGRRLSVLPEFCDYEFDCKKWYEGMSSSLATWFACHMGGDPVLLCGMDCYQGEKPYFYERTEYDNSREMARPLDNHIRPWLNARVACRNSENIKAVSGPLIKLFGEYTP